jgi:adenine-specific DNA methylase
MLLGLLLPDPSDPHCPIPFKEKARRLLQGILGEIGEGDLELRHALLKFVAGLSEPERARNGSFLEMARALIRVAQDGDAPLVADPFAGAGSIPLEAARLGCEVFASDLNPVSALILKVVLEDVPRTDAEFLPAFRRAGEAVKRMASAELADFYPRDPDGSRPIVYLWARTVRCEEPHCGAEIPLVSSFWLSRSAGRRCALRFEVIRAGRGPELRFDTFEPTNDSDVSLRNVSRARARCLCCQAVLAPGRVRAQLRDQKGGTDPVFDAGGNRVGGARLLAVALVPDDGGGTRHYRAATPMDYAAVRGAGLEAARLAHEVPLGDLSLVPDESLPLMSGTFNVPIYGIDTWGRLFSTRQALTIGTISRAIRAVAKDQEQLHGELLAFALSKFARHCNGNARWNNVVQSAEPAFGTQALPMTWTFPESVPWGPWAENYDASVEAIATTLERGFDGVGSTSQVQIADARRSPLPDEACDVWFTDPPYYFAVPYADLSDFFYVWLRRTLPGHPLLADPFDPLNRLTPKAQELCEMAHWDPDRYGDKDQVFFETGMRVVFDEGRRVLKPDGIACVVFAHKTTEAWEALLSGMVGAGWVITASWPIATERPGRLRARESAALAASVHLVCRPRSDNAGVGDWADVLRELPSRVGDWMERLQGEGVRGADLVFACIGPALEIFSRYTRVETADGREVKLDEYLEKVWEVVGRTALGQVLGTAEARARNGAAGAVEEDARLTALFLWTLQATEGESPDAATQEDEDGDDVEDGDDEEDSGRKAKGLTLVFDVVRRFAQPLGIDLPRWDGRVIETKKGVVRLLPVSERAKQLFGEDGAQAVALRIEQDAALGLRTQLSLFPEERQPELRMRGARRGRKGSGSSTQSSRSGAAISEDALTAPREATTLDRVHAAMLLQAGGRTNALRALVKAEQERSPDFLRLANALSALYPKGSEEKRLLDAMLLAVPR